MVRNRLNFHVWLTFVAGLIALEVAVQTGLIPKLVLPAPSSVISQWLSDMISCELPRQIACSLGLLFVALMLALLLALGLALLGRRFKYIRQLLKALSGVLSPIPSIAVLPIFLLWLGIGTAPTIATMLHATVWPMLAELSDGIATRPQIYSSIADSFAITGRARLWHIDLPALLPVLLTSLKSAWGRAWRALIGVEMIFGSIGESGGVGWYIFKHRVFFDVTGMFAGLLTVALVGIAIEVILFTAIERRTIVKWGMKK